MKTLSLLLILSALFSSIHAKTTSPLKKKVSVAAVPKIPKVPVNVNPKIVQERQVRSSAKVGSLAKFYNWYLGQCTDNPIVTKSTTCAVVCSIGDILAQKLESNLAEQAFSLDLSRMSSFLLCGLVFVGPFVHIWYDVLMKMAKGLETKFGITKFKQVTAQVLLDQTVGVAFFFPLYFFVFEYMESLVNWRTPSLSNAGQKCSEQIRKVVLMQYRVFPVCNIINFGFVPPALRVLFSNSVSLFWNIYLCTILAE
jgi:hypothetical protein